MKQQREGEGEVEQCIEDPELCSNRGGVYMREIDLCPVSLVLSPELQSTVGQKMDGLLKILDALWYSLNAPSDNFA